LSKNLSFLPVFSVYHYVNVHLPLFLALRQWAVYLIFLSNFLLCTFCTFVMVGAGYYLDINYLFPGYSPFVSTTSSISSPILFTHFIFLRETLELWYFRLNVLTYSHLQRNSKVSKFHPSHPFYPFSIAASRHSLLLFWIIFGHFGLISA
jgi:hypothetical protein